MEDDANKPQISNGNDWTFAFYGETAEVTSEPIERDVTVEPIFPLTMTKAGDRVTIVGFNGKDSTSRLLGMGLIPGVETSVISSTPGGSVILKLQNNRIGLSAGIASKVVVTNRPISQTANNREKRMETDKKTRLQDLAMGAKGRIVGYEKSARSYQSKLLSMGLTPGTKFAVIRQAPLGDPVEIEVRGFKLSLRKQEADTLRVEEVHDA